MEEASILHPTTCGFIKVAAYELVSSKCPVDERIRQILALLEFEIHSETIRRKPKIVESIKKIGKRKREIKDRILSTFSIKTWNDLTDLDNKNHTFSRCQGCIKNGNFIMLLNEFPINKYARLH